MKELKFRAWDKKMNKMENFGDYLYWFEEEGVARLPDHQYEIMQFTGLYDKNGKEIYEGDMVKISDNLPPYEVIVNDFTMVHCIDNDHGQDELWKHHKKCEVIGNIYE